MTTANSNANIVTIANDLVVTIAARITELKSGDLLQDIPKNDPEPYLHGHGNIIPGMERALTGRKVGDRFEVEVAAKDGFGDVREELIQTVAKDAFPADLMLEIGAEFEIEPDEGTPFTAAVVDIQENTVIIDGNHPLAGLDLKCAVEVLAIRPATAVELEHGHAHSAEGCSSEH